MRTRRMQEYQEKVQQGQKNQEKVQGHRKRKALSRGPELGVVRLEVSPAGQLVWLERSLQVKCPSSPGVVLGFRWRRAHTTGSSTHLLLILFSPHPHLLLISS